MKTLSFHAMGSQVNLWLRGSDDLSTVSSQIEDLEQILSRFRGDSELCQLNQSYGCWQTVSGVMRQHLDAALQAARVTNGLVNPLILKSLVLAGYDRDFASIQPSNDLITTPIHLADWRDILLEGDQVWLPCEIDLGGTAKGWTAQHIANQFDDVLVDIGGDIVARGGVWDVHIADPFELRAFATVQLKNQTIATSGTDFRHWGDGQHHIIDPRTGQPADTDVMSAVVIHPEAVFAEAFAKAVLLQGSQRGLIWLQQHADAAGLVFCHDGSVLTTSNFQQFML